MNAKTQNITHTGSGDINVDSTVNNITVNGAFPGADALAELNRLLQGIEKALPARLPADAREDVAASLHEIRQSTKEPDAKLGKSKMRRALVCLKDVVQRAGPATAFAAAVAELIAFFAKL